MAYMELAFEEILVIKIAQNRPEGSCGAPCPLFPLVAIRVRAAMRIFHPVMQVRVVLLAAGFVANVAISFKGVVRLLVVVLAQISTRLRFGESYASCAGGDGGCGYSSKEGGQHCHCDRQLDHGRWRVPGFHVCANSHSKEKRVC